MNKKFFITLGIVLLAVLVLGYLLWANFFSYGAHLPVPFNPSIITSEEAIVYAKANLEVQSFLERNKQYGPIDEEASFDEPKHLWTVRFTPTKITDTCLWINFYVNGTILGKEFPCVA